MATFILKSIASGAVFGAALTAAGVYSPSIIIGQMYFTNFHMLKAFIAASASSAIAILFAQRNSNSNCKPRLARSINLFSTYDGNILGGLLLGFGMTLTGACPGTVLPQVATSVSSGPFVLLGGVLGGILWSGYGKQFLVQQTKDPLGKPKPQSPITIHQQLGISESSGLITYEVLCLSILGAATLFAPEGGKALVPPILGGLFIGFSQLTSLVLTANTLGVSTAYEQIGDFFWWLWSSFSALTHKQNITATPNVTSTALVLGTLLGSWTLSRTINIPETTEIKVPILRALIGGSLLTFGGRLAGGCTSGHGISGMSLLSTSSFISVAAMFIGGMGLAALLG